MRILPVAVAALLVAGGMAKEAAASDMLVANICEYVKSDDRNLLRKKLKESRMKLRQVYDGIKCDGHSLVRFAMVSGANESGEFIVSRLPSSKLKKPEADGMTVGAWAESQGHGASPIAAAVKERIGG
ncbi:DUF3718 domain-containing protein [Shewanella corallii]|uniref:DUF3718 domain-containing protein n=2 Tax=Shewanella TaxID=22 RepID=A0ABT0N5T2_9GAMM|nr:MULTISPECIES: DUF3718 domain-containing protein [Shewanella]MCL1037321.1 DUF3718 domain-containing protein [Shewanella submarina]MCL2913809.1 DUF3718 domain-containing protein [Shewanella corallii]